MSIVSASVESIDQKMAFNGRVRNFAPIQFDYVQPYGEDLAAGPMEYVLVALSTCTSAGVAMLLRKAGGIVESIKALATADRSDTHPTVFRSIVIELIIYSPNLNTEAVETALVKAETILCPVYIMLSKAVDIKVKYQLNRTTS